jgi:hypothetical protein
VESRAEGEEGEGEKKFATQLAPENWRMAYETEPEPTTTTFAFQISTSFQPLSLSLTLLYRDKKCRPQNKARNIQQ